MKRASDTIFGALAGTPISASRLRGLSRAARTFARRHPLGAVSALILLAIAIVAVAAPLIAPHDPIYVNIDHFKENPSLSFPAGTDYYGRGVLSRIIHGARISLSASFLSVLLGTTTGSIWGLSSAYIGGRFDIIGQRVLDMIMAFPALILAMIMVTGLGTGFWVVVISIAVTRIPLSTRVIRSVTLSVKENEYVLAAKAIGAGSVRVMAFHIAPQCLASFLIIATMHLGVVILIEASLGFIGVGIGPPTPTWGRMLGGAVEQVLIPHWPMVLFPGIAITITVLAFNLFGDALRDALDPRLRGTESG